MMRRKVFAILLTLAMVFTYMPALAFAEDSAQGEDISQAEEPQAGETPGDTEESQTSENPGSAKKSQINEKLSTVEKKSTYGFFVWLSENAATDAEKEDAAIAAQIISNTLTSENKGKVFNQGNIYGGSHDISYSDLLASVELGGENDATSLENLRDAVNFISSGNSYRAKESLPALKVSSAMMAMAELNVDYQDKDAVFDHSSVFSALENLSYRLLGGTWQYGTVGGGSSDDPYEGWYTKEKENYDSNNGGQTGHYLTLTDRQGSMLLTGFGVRHRYVTQYITASDGNQYECLMHYKYYSQMFSSKSGMYSVGNGVTPSAYLAYLDKYQCEVSGHTYGSWTITKEATCTEDGLREHSCSVCGTKEEEVIAALGHDWGEWAITTKPTASKEGEQQRTCSRCGAVEKEAIPKLDVPEITSQPKDVSVAAGEKATFKVTADGTGLKYQWQWKSGSRAWANTTLSGYNTDTLSFTAADAHHGRQYRCVVTNDKGKTAESNGATLTILSDGPEITVQPKNVKTTVGAKATFKVTASGIGLKYQWQWKSGSRAWANTTLSGYNTNTLSFTTAEAHQGRQYRCIVTDCNGVSAVSTAATLTLSYGPVITSHPVSVKVVAGAKATFKVTANGSGLKYQWQWKSGSRDWANTNLSGYNTNTLSFIAQAAHNGRRYRCVVTNSEGKSVTTIEVTLTVKTDFAITTQPSDVSAAVGDKATFKVSASGSGLKYQWQWKSGNRAWANTTLSGYNTNTLSFTVKEAHHGRQYRCVIRDADGVSINSDAATLSVVEELTVTEQPEDVTVNAGEEATFKVIASGVGLKYQWQWKTDNRAWANTTLSGYNTDTLSFAAQAAHNGRQYRCVITDANGDTVESEGAMLTVTEE